MEGKQQDTAATPMDFLLKGNKSARLTKNQDRCWGKKQGACDNRFRGWEKPSLERGKEKKGCDVKKNNKGEKKRVSLLATGEKGNILRVGTSGKNGWRSSLKKRKVHPAEGEGGESF